MAPGILADEVPNGTHGKNKDTEVPEANGHVETENPKLKNGETAQDGKEPEKDRKEEVEDGSMKCEIKHLDRRYNDKDERYFTERKTDSESAEKKDWWRLFAFCLVRHYDADGDLDQTRLYVNPQPLRQLLRDVIGDYPGDPIDVDEVQIESPYHSLFHYRKQLESEGRKRFADDEESLAELNLLLDWIKTHFESEITAYEKCISGELRAIAFDRLWTLFPPGTIVHSKVLLHDRAFRVTETQYYDDDDETPGLEVSADFIDFDGERLGTRASRLFIPKYVGTRQLSELTTMPLDLLDEADDVRKELVERGRKFEGYVGQHFLQYNGIAIKKTSEGYARFSVSGRVMIDCKTYHRLEPNDSWTVDELENDETAKRGRGRRNSAGTTDFVSRTTTHARLSDEDVILTNTTVRGYTFTVKKFLEFFVDQLSPIEWNTRCFDDLVLDPQIKKTVQALVTTHTQKRDSFDDIVKGKGQGLVCVLHGPPGVGKTLTAECVAEYVRRPLYMVSSGDLGTSSIDLDRQLTRIMDMTATWRAVLLIDEADVFLERRSLHDLHRNAMVSVFLRVLEYYGGILFLTTNRVTTFDDAFKSRIHVPIRYTDLSVESRRQIWRNFCTMVPGGVDVDDAGLAVLAEHDLNGRQIKNVVKAAESLATFEGVRLDFNQLQQVAKIQATFEKDLTNLNGVDYTAPGQTRKDADSRNMFL